MIRNTQSGFQSTDPEFDERVTLISAVECDDRFVANCYKAFYAPRGPNGVCYDPSTKGWFFWDSDFESWLSFTPLAS